MAHYISVAAKRHCRPIRVEKCHRSLDESWIRLPNGREHANIIRMFRFIGGHVLGGSLYTIIVQVGIPSHDHGPSSVSSGKIVVSQTLGIHPQLRVLAHADRIVPTPLCGVAICIDVR